MVAILITIYVHQFQPSFDDLDAINYLQIFSRSTFFY